MSVRGATSMWTALIRPHLEYGAEVINNHNDFVWEEAELLARKVGRRVLRCGVRLPNDAVLGELGWMTMRGRRMFLRLSYWGKVLEMGAGRWVKRVYEEGRAKLETRATASTWCNLTKKWLMELGLREEWEAQETGPEWQETLRARIMELESRRWRRRVAQHQAGELRQVEAQAGAGRVSRTCKCEAEEAVDEAAWWMLGVEGGDRQVGADVCGWAAGGGASSP